MSIADQVIENLEANKGSQPDGYDELGLYIVDNADYIAARMIKRNWDKYREGKEGLLHKRKDGIYIGDEHIDCTLDNIYRLSAINRPVRGYERPQVWEILKQHIPELDESKIIIDDYSYWDIEKGELCRSDIPMYHI